MSTACIVAAVCIFVAGLFAVIVERTNERDEARYERDLLEGECDSHAAENARLAGELDARDATIADLRRAQLRVVPTQRSGSHDRLSDDAWFGRLYDENGGHRG